MPIRCATIRRKRGGGTLGDERDEPLTPRAEADPAAGHAAAGVLLPVHHLLEVAGQLPLGAHHHPARQLEIGAVQPVDHPLERLAALAAG